MLFRILISIVLIGIPYGVYHFYNFETAIISGLCLIVFLIVSIREDILQISDKPKKSTKE